MKIGIITHYNVNNQGAQLQMYSLCNVLKELGHQPVILTYEKNYDFDKEKQLRFQASIKSIPYYIKNYLLKSGIGATYRNYKKLKMNKEFRKKMFEFSNYATTNVDMAIVGSDEVFSIPMGVNMMMYGHCLATKKVIAYAPSFGQTDLKLLDKHNATILVGEGLKQFIALSSRDKHTFEMIKSLTGREPSMVCDPAILYKFKNNEITNTIKVPKQQYMVIYAYDHNMTDQKEINAIKQFAKDKNLKIVSPGTYHKWCDKNISCNALQWVEIIKNAKYVITDTFHGTIISTIMNVPMAVLVRDELNSNKMLDLLGKLNIEQRKLSKITIEELHKVLDSQIDFKKINNCINELRENSLLYLKEAIKKCEEIRDE